MPIAGFRVPGGRHVVITLDPRTALDVYFSLAAAKFCDETTLQQRLTVAGLLPQFKRALVATNIVSAHLLDDYDRQLQRKPTPPPLDTIIARALRNP